jgi:subtilisin family serine protease
MIRFSSGKKLFLVLLFLLCSTTVTGARIKEAGLAYGDTGFWYYHENQIIQLQWATNQIAVVFKNNLKTIDKPSTLASLDRTVSIAEVAELTYPEMTLLQLDPDISRYSFLQSLDDLRADPSVNYAFPVFGQGDARMILTDQFMVQFKSSTTLDSIQTYNHENNVTVVKELSLPNTYLMQAGDSLDVLAVANRYHESELTVYSEPDFVFMLTSMSYPDDTHYPEQWGMENTGSNIPSGSGTEDADMDVEAAWAIEKGNPDTIIAIIDMGVDLNHDDLDDKIVAEYTAIPDDTDANPQSSSDGHGTSCAGIAVAETNNALGVAGMCPQCSLMVIQVAYQGPYGMVTQASWAVDGINWAVDHGADVLSASWGFPPSSASTAVNQAILHATTDGRAGLGSLFLAAVGNFNENLIYWPASLSNTIAVGASSPCDERKNPDSCDGEDWGSHYGPELDIVAPGVRWWTTDMTGEDGFVSGDYLAYFSGTSSSTPAAAGLAGLIISYRSCLTQTQVRNIIEQSADDLVGNPSEDSAGWDQYMGWGRINAHQALLSAGSYSCIYVPIIQKSSE